ncbi:MAG TPA: Asp-tRNA(Asn)/Glu-tRNA(Gln) amidotransferase subunit GatC [Acidimicrobiia bacterium]|nr:Asp-tRNA(Asn)/Glu-tRNA(Gln) amidotransferase subunit GatC [Acidimicrobiia bacterium]
MPIEIDIGHVARLARLGLSEDDLEMYRRQLGTILEHASRVQSVATDDVEPTSHPLGLTNAFRADEVRPSLDRGEVLSQAPDHADGYFVVPPALEIE